MSKFDISFAITSFVLGFTAFFMVSGIPVTEYIMFVACTAMVNVGLGWTFRRNQNHHLIAVFIALFVAIGAAFYIWGRDYFYGGLAASAVWTTSALVWGAVTLLSARIARS